MRFPRKRGSTSVMVRVFIPKNDVTTGAGLTGLTNASTNLTVAYIRELSGTSVTYTGANLEAQTTIGTYQAPSTSAKLRFKEVDATNFPGVYELQFHDSATAFSTGDTSQNVTINIYEASTSALHIGPNAVLIPLVPWDYQDGVRMGLTALPNAAADAAGGLVISDAGGLDADAQRSDVAAILVDTGTTLDARIPAALVGGRMDASVGAMANDVVTAAAIAADAIGASELATDAVAEIADAVWDEAIAGHAGAGSTGAALAGATAPTAAAVADAVWDETLASHLGAGSTGEALNAAGAAGDPWVTALPGAYGAGSAGKILGDNLNATVSSRASQTSVDDVPTNAELATALGTADDAVLAAIAALNNLSQANIRTAVGLASANLDTQLADLPTNSELAAALAAADDAVLAAIAALNNLSQANVRTALGLASANLDTQLDALPTNAELATALGTADDAVLAAIAALNNLSAAQVKTQVVAALATDTYAEPTAPPAATATLAAKLGWLTILARNVVTQTATEQKVKADNGTTDVGTATVSDDATTFTRGEWT